MNLDWLKGSALIAFVVGFWDKIKSFLWLIVSIFVQRIEIKTQDAHDTVIAYLVTKYRRLPFYNKIYGAQYDSFRNGKYGLVPYEKFGHSTIVFLTNRCFLGFIRLPFVFSQENVNPLRNDSPSNNASDPDRTFSAIMCLRGTLRPDDIVRKSILARNRITWNLDEAEERSNRFNIFYFPERENTRQENRNHYTGFAWFRQKQFRILGIREDELGRERKSDKQALENLYFPKEVKSLIREVGLWVKSRDWYKQKHIPWKRGWLLYGPPGTGKTALARAFAEDLDLPIYVYSLAQMSNYDLIKAWQSMQLNIPCIALIEDIDSVFDKRKNISQNPLMFSRMFQGESADEPQEQGLLRTPITFDTLLNCIDGIDKTDGVFTIITTNDINKIDPAIGVPQTHADGTQVVVSTRPGRIDCAIRLTYMSRENKLEMANKLLRDFPERLQEMLEHIDLGLEETPAQFQEYCSQAALQEFWKTQS